jgi:hypothetical protein
MAAPLLEPAKVFEEGAGETLYKKFRPFSQISAQAASKARPRLKPLRGRILRRLANRSSEELLRTTGSQYCSTSFS